MLKSFSTLKIGEIEPAHIVEDRRMRAGNILLLLGDDMPDDVEMLALSGLSRAGLAICDHPQDPDVIEQFESAGAEFLRVSPPGGHQR